MTATLAHNDDQAPPDRRMVILDRLAEIGLNMAESLEDERKAVTSGERTDSRGPELARLTRAIDRVSRMVHLSMMLRDRLIKDEVKSPRADRRQALEHAVRRICWNNDTPAYKLPQIRAELAQRLDNDDCYGDLLARPFSEILDHVCKDVRIDPQWAKLAGEAWAKAEIESGEVGWPLGGLAPPPDPPPKALPLNGEGLGWGVSTDLANDTS